MTPERWKKIDAIVQKALDLPSEQRQAYLDSQCRHDPTLRHEVESLISYQQNASRFLQSPALKDAALLIGNARSPSLEGRSISHYKLARKIGEGGMGSVYLAHDTSLDRKVAIKFLSDDLTADDLARKRLVREARAAARLDHANICSVYEVAEHDGLTYIVMQYVEGETLSERINRKPLEISEAIDIAVQVADALAEAHTRGIIHRDIKPQNIMLTSRGQVKVLDFGLAKMVRREEVAASEIATESLMSEPGMIAGTVPYMSPEQLRGEAIDARSDIFSFGVVLYEMITGQQPFARDSAAEMIAAIQMVNPPSLRDYRREVPEGLEAIVEKTLNKEREGRYQAVEEMLDELKAIKGQNIETETESDASRWLRKARVRRLRLPLLVACVLAVAIAAMVYFLITNRSGEAQPSAQIRSIAVLPAKPLVPERRNESLELSLAATLITRLSSTGQIVVPSISSVSKYASLDQDPIAAGQELKVDAVLESSILWEGDKIRVMGRLLRVADGATLWADKCDQQCTSIFDVHDLISEEIVKALGKHLTDDQERLLVKRDTQNPDAYRLYSKGLYHMFRRTVADTEKAVRYFEQAIGLDPEYALAWYGLAFSYGSVGDLGGIAPKEVLSKAKTTLVRALELDDQLADAHALQGFYLMAYDWDWSGARRKIERAIELNPNSAECHSEYGWYLICVGRFDEAIREMQTAVELEPASPYHNRNLGFTFYFARQYDRAIEQLQKTLDLDPNYVSAYGWMGFSYVEKGDYDRAVEAYLKQGYDGSAGNPEAIKAMREAYETRGWRGYLQKRVELMEDQAKKGYIQPDIIAIFYTQLGERDRALDMLEKACDERQLFVTALNVSPWWDDLRSEPRFQKLLRRVGLPQ